MVQRLDVGLDGLEITDAACERRRSEGGHHPPVLEQLSGEDGRGSDRT